MIVKESEKSVSKAALIVLKGCRKKLTKQEYKTLRGQILAGDDVGAMKGLNRLLAEKEGASV